METKVSAQPFRYRSDRRDPDFDDGKALFVFDGICAVIRLSLRWADPAILTIPKFSRLLPGGFLLTEDSKFEDNWPR